MRVLFVSSEVHPLMKTGGLADVSASLPRALQTLGHDLRVLMPAYRDALAVASTFGVKILRAVELDGHGVRLLETRLPNRGIRIWLLDCPALFDRPGNPYHDRHGHDYPDNAARFMLLCRAGAALAVDAFGLGWRPEVVHCNDWQSALVPLLLHETRPRPALVFTIHNLAYQGIFGASEFGALGLAPRYWHHEALEFHGNMSFIKGALVYADRITTVSPSYAREIQGAACGHGLDGLLVHRQAALSGILNGIDTREWNPARDPALVANYGVRSLEHKGLNKRALQAELGLETRAELPLLAFVGRLVEQKGIDLLLQALPALLAGPPQVVLLGSGEARHESALRALAARHHDQVAVRIGYDEALAHRIEAAADMFLMPSRFEPCGLNQMYSLRYGTVPVVHGVGGLADTVIDASPANLGAGTANGFVYHGNRVAALGAACERALAAWQDAALWRRLQQAGMRGDFSWRRSAREYQRLYEDAIGETEAVQRGRTVP